MNLIRINDLSRDTLEDLLQQASFFSKSPLSTHSILKNQFIATLFFENSTRTRFSFEIAARRLQAEVLNFDADSSSEKKGESLYDTLKTFEAMGVEAAIIRHQDESIWQDLQLPMKLINAGTGIQSHPTQALIDAFTLYQHFGKVEGLKVAIVGDIPHSRVAVSNRECLTKLGATVTEWTPPLFADDKPSQHWEELLPELDALMLLRVQHERHQQTVGVESYLQQYGLTSERFHKLAAHAVIMHPGPFNRGVEIESSLCYHPRSLIFNQVQNGVLMRMAILKKVLQS